MPLNLKSRRCKSCGLLFAAPDSIRTHKRDGICRPADALRALGWRETPRGWLHPLTPATRAVPLKRALRRS